MMGERQDPGGGALESHHFGANFGPGKDHFSAASTSNGNVLTDLSSDTHLTLLKGGSGLGSFSYDTDGLSRLGSDVYTEMRFIQLSDWGDLAGYATEGMSARLVDSRSLNDSPDNAIQYRPWEKPDPSLASPINTQPSTTASPPGQVFVATNGSATSTTSNKSPTTLTTLTNAFPAFSDAFNGQKLPSFQSQFNSFNEPPMHHQGNGDLMHSPAPVSTSSPPASSLPSFHTLPPNRGYIHSGPPPPTLVATSQGQPQFLDERHIQIFPGQIISATPVSTQNHHQGIVTNGQGAHFVMNGHPGTNGPSQHFIGNGSGQQFLELVPVSPMQIHSHYPPPPPLHHQHAKLQPQTTDGNIPSLNLNDLHHTHHNSNMNLNNLNGPPPTIMPTTKYLTNDGHHLETLITVKVPHGAVPYDPHGHHRVHHHAGHQPKLEQSSPQLVTNSNGHGHGASPLPPKNKSQKRKRNMENSLENYNSHPFNNNNSHDLNDPQVSSVSSTDSDFKRGLGHNGGMDHGHIHNAMDQGDMEKPVKKKRKRCGECTGCQRKDNCGDCAPCRNEKSHQICKVRRCEKLTEKKSRAGRGIAAAVMK